MVNKEIWGYVDKFMKLFLDDFSIYGDMDNHLEIWNLHLRNVLNMA